MQNTDNRNMEILIELGLESQIRQKLESQKSRQQYIIDSKTKRICVATPRIGGFAETTTDIERNNVTSRFLRCIAKIPSKKHKGSAMI